MRSRGWWIVLLLALSCGLAAHAQGLPAVPDTYFEVLGPQSDDLGHYLGVHAEGTYPVIVVVASSLKISSIHIGAQTGPVGPVAYQVNGAPPGLATVGVRTRVPLSPNSTLHVSASDEQGNVRDAYWLPDRPSTLQRLQFWVTVRPGDPYVNLRLANADGQARNMQAAEPRFATVIANNPDYVLARHLRALCYLDNDNLAAARADLQWLLDKYPDYNSARVDFARLLFQAGDNAGAIAMYLKAIQNAPKSSEALYMLGVVLRAQGDVPGALTAQQSAVAADPNAVDASGQLGLAQLQQGDLDNAQANLRNEVNTNWRNPDYSFGLAQLYYQRHQYKRAWKAVAHATAWGGTPDPAFIAALSARMAPPRDVIGASGAAQ